MKIDISNVFSINKVNLYCIQRKAAQYFDAIIKPEDKGLPPQKEDMYNLPLLIAKFSQFNYQIYCHFIKEIGKQFIM